MFGSVNQQDLAAYYRDADVALITPLRDGMNLVAKEFVACQSDENPGVLVLSPFAGAGGLMQEAILANPYEVDRHLPTGFLFRDLVRVNVVVFIQPLRFYPLEFLSMTIFVHDYFQIVHSHFVSTVIFVHGLFVMAIFVRDHF